MAKNELLSKLNLKDYNKELELIIEKKDFSSQVKNLLLSMFYKLETNYKDYSIVKQDVSSKESFMKSIMNIIETKCNKVELVKPKQEDLRKFWIYPEEGKIECYQNEYALLHAILDIGNKEFFIPEEYNALKKAIRNLLVMGNELDTKELITNFDGWAWNNNVDKFDDTESYLIYENLRILMGNTFLHEWKRDRRKKDYISDIIKVSQDFWEKFCQYAILKISINSDDKKELKAELNKIEEQLSKMEDKNEFLQEIYKNKKTVSDRIKILDKILNDNYLLKEEFLSRNSELTQEEKIFSISDLEEIIQKERNSCIEEMQRYNYILEPKNYIKKIESLKDKINLIKSAKFEEIDEKTIQKRLLNLQIIFMQCLKQKVENSKTKKEMVDLIYAFRYYLYLPIKINGKMMIIKEVEELKRELEQIGKDIITKSCKLNAIMIINKDISYNFQIIQKILDTKIINLEDIHIIFSKSDADINVEVYDKEMLDRTASIDREKDKEQDFMIKFNKKIKLFA